jgi:hypothetical protein
MQYVQALDKAPFYYEKISVTTAAVFRLNATYRADSNAVFITVEDESIRYRIDGGDPDINDGHVVTAGANLYMVNPKSIKELRMIGFGGTAVVIVTYYK